MNEIIPSLADLVSLWLKDVLPPRVFEKLRLVHIMPNNEWYVLYFPGRSIAYLYEDNIVLLYDGRSHGPRLYAADPEFFEKLGDHIKKQVKKSPELYLTTY